MKSYKKDILIYVVSIIVTMIASMATIPITAYCAPVITSTDGNIVHGQNIIIRGSGFKTKSTASPVVWDDCSGTNVSSKWDGSDNAAYKTPAEVGRGVSPAHSNVTKYLCGYPTSSSKSVMVWKTRTVSSFPVYTYACWYERIDPNFNWNVDSTDDNFKEYDWSRGTWPYDGDYGEGNNWYAEWYFRSSWHLVDDSPITGISSSSQRWGASHSDLQSGWHKYEIEVCITNQSSGYIKIWDDGVLKLNYTGPTDGYSGTARNDGIGGYMRDYGTTNWRYFNDIYLDYTRARVIIGNAPTLNGSTKREIQIPSTWTDGLITININQGCFLNGQSAYLYVVNSDGEVNSNGFPIIIGQSQGISSDTIPPNKPTGIKVEVNN